MGSGIAFTAAILYLRLIIFWGGNVKECNVKKIGSNMIELHFRTREIEYVKQNGAHSCVVKFR